MRHQIEDMQRATAKPLNAEIERLGKDIDRLCGEVGQLLEEVERLRAEAVADQQTKNPPGDDSRRAIYIKDDDLHRG